MAKAKRKNAGPKRDVYAEITNQIIAAIEAGEGEPVMPWARPDFAIHMPRNVASGNVYNGVNVIGLWATAMVREYSEGLWGTYRQWKAKGAQVKKGEKGALAIFYKQLEAKEEATNNSGDGESDDNQRRFFARASTVFNVAQVEGYEAESDERKQSEIEPCEAAEAAIAATGAEIVVGGTRAFYSRSTDKITMPDRELFTGTQTMNATESWFAVLLHELTHWSGAAHRLDRKFGEKFGDDAYAMEELVAEIGAAFLCSTLGVSIEPRADHAAYIGHWLRIMKGDSKAIFTASSQASKAANFILQ